MVMKPRQKLSDVEANTSYFLQGPTTTFVKAFPEIESLLVEVAVEKTWGQQGYLMRFTHENVPSIINCGNPRCFGGGLKLQDLLRWQVFHSKRTEFSGRESCVGYEGSPKGRKRTGSCDHAYQVKVAVTYRSASPQPEVDD